MIEQINLNHVLEDLENLVRCVKLHGVKIANHCVVLTMSEAVLDDHGGSPLVGESEVIINKKSPCEFFRTELLILIIEIPKLMVEELAIRYGRVGPGFRDGHGVHAKSLVAS